MNRTKIEYLDFSWSPIAMRCTPVSEGCKHCWHIQMANRLAKNPSILFNESNAYSGLEKPYLVRSRLDQPLKRKKPARIGVQFMGDLFHDDILGHHIHRIIKICKYYASQHTYLFLTKRLERMRRIWMNVDGVLPQNCWLGMSAENQQTFTDRWLIAQQIPGFVWVSMEPMLEPIQFLWNARKPNWVVIGGLSLPSGKVQAPDPEWIADIERQCDEAGVPLFLKDNAQYHRTRQEFPV